MDSPGRGRSRPVLLACPASKADAGGELPLPSLLLLLLLLPECAPLPARHELLNRPGGSAATPAALLGPAPMQLSRSLLPCRHVPFWLEGFSFPGRSKTVSCSKHGKGNQKQKTPQPREVVTSKHRPLLLTNVEVVYSRAGCRYCCPPPMDSTGHTLGCKLNHRIEFKIK